jgi:DNA modification methylase
VLLLEINKIHCGNSLDILKAMKDNSFQCCITSPPYFGLRDYGIKNQIGLEATPDEYTKKLVDVFREVKRVLKEDGTLWLNLGDSYAGSWGNAGHRPELDNSPSYQREKNSDYVHRGGWDGRRERPAASYKLPGIKQKDLIGIPWKVAFALRDDNWYLRSDIIWAKGTSGQKDLISQIHSAGIKAEIDENKIESLIDNLGLYVGGSMPESVRDRPSKSHEYLFLLSKNKKYYYDNDVIKEDSVTNDPRKPYTSIGAKELDGRKTWHSGEKRKGNDFTKRNRRSVWTIPTKPIKAAHFAIFPEKLVEPCILAGCPEGGICLDPFFGSGTVGVVASKLNRNYVGIDLNPEYVKIASDRINKVSFV